MEAEACQPAAAPDPVGLNGVNQRGDHTGIDAVGQELGTLRHGTGNDGRSGGAEYQVEYEAGEIEAFVGGEQVEPGLADEAKQVFTHQQTETDQDEDNCANAEVHQVLHDDIAGVFGSGKTGFHHCKASLHPENQCRADQIPYTPYFTHNLTSLVYVLSFFPGTFVLPCDKHPRKWLSRFGRNAQTGKVLKHVNISRFPGGGGQPPPTGRPGRHLAAMKG